MRADSSTSIIPSLILQSAGIAEPAANFTKSPGTSSVALIYCHCPSLLAVATGFREFFSAATASPALIVSYHPIVALAI